MKTSLFAAACGLGLAGSAFGAVNFTGVTITENFNGLPTANQTNFLAATKVTVPGTIFEAVDTDGTGSPTLTADDGSSNAGGIHSYATTAAPGERALGSIASGSAIPAFGVEITNNTGAALTSITVSFSTEVYRNSTSTQNVLNAQYIVGAAGQADYLTAAATDIDALDIVGPAPVTTNGIVSPPTSTPVSATLAVNIPVGSSFYLRFVDANEVGNDAGLAIDDFSVSVPEPTTLAAVLGLGGLVARRRRA